MNKLTLPPSWLKNSTLKVAIIGAGGTGSEVLAQIFSMDVSLKMLGRAGLDISIFDFDTVSEWNLGRQRFWPVDVNLPKATVLAKRFCRSWPNASIKGFNKKVSLSSFNNTLSTTDLIISCVDSGQWRWNFGKDLQERSKKVFGESEVLWLDCGNDRDSGQIILGHANCPADRDRIPNVFDLHPELESSEDRDEDSCSAEQALSKQDFGINNEIASKATQMLWQLLRYGHLDYSGVLVNLSQSIMAEKLPINPELWKLYGYAASAPICL